MAPDSTCGDKLLDYLIKKAWQVSWLCYFVSASKTIKDHKTLHQAPSIIPAPELCLYFTITVKLTLSQPGSATRYRKLLWSAPTRYGGLVILDWYTCFFLRCLSARFALYPILMWIIAGCEKWQDPALPRINETQSGILTFMKQKINMI